MYEAFDPELGRTVALKALKPGRTKHQLSEEWIKREAEAFARLDHPAIVTIFDVGTCPAGAYLVMELLRGETLARRVDRGPLPVDEALRIAAQMAEGLAHAHSRGVLHRDLEPANVFVCEDGRVKLLDFGLAHLLGTEGSSGAGTPADMAPEQAAGAEIDERADVYAAGMVLGEALTGHRPSRGDSADEWPQAHRPGLPRGIERQIEAAISADPAARPRDGASWLAAIQRLQRERARPRILRRVALLAGVGLLLGVLASGIATWRVWRRQVPVGRITVAVADFANQTGDPELDGLSGLLSASLEQSKRLRVLTRSRMWDYARELRMGNVVELRALDPERDEYLFTVQERASDKAAVLGLVDRLSDRTRVEQNEPQQEVASNQVRVEVAVTGSLEADAHYFRAQQIMAELLDSDLARKEYAQALAIDPEFVQAHLQLALLAALGESDGNEGDAEAHLEAVLRQAGRIPEKDRHLAEVLAELRKPDGSGAEGKERMRAVLRSAVKALPDSKELLALAGQRAVDDDDYEVAVQRLAKELKAGTVPAELYRGIEAWKGGNADVAVPIFRGVIAKTEDGAAVRYLGEILCDGTEPAEGAVLRGRWLERFPSAVALGSYIFRPRTLLLAARCLEKQGRIQEARSTVDRLLVDWGGADAGLPILVEVKAMRARLQGTKG